MAQRQFMMAGYVIPVLPTILLLLMLFVEPLSEIHRSKILLSKNELQRGRLRVVMHDKNLSDEDLQIIMVVELMRG